MATHNRHILNISAQIISAHARHNQVAADALTGAIQNVYRTLVELSPAGTETPEPAPYTHAEHHAHHHDHSGHAHPASDDVYVHPAYGQTVFGDHLICMEDGLSMKMLKRHLLTVHDMTPEEYRAKWELPESYPMVARDYAKLRSSLALQSGLGLKPDDRGSKGRKARSG